ncbi:DUF4124 domain-containing protein [Pseudomonas sp.]|jgi:hypothetical protein|uniref:DUF4124 domain-containing protein n=1 Tax=Pseudomonas sp. TaxID=306 RepID=UPI00272ABF56|nr:DUF4124 domain-containing protein [Pseudomonas sp.]
MNRISRYSRASVLACSTLLSASLSAGVYTWTDAEGNRVFSDQPRPGSTEVQVGPTNTVETPPPAQFNRPASQPERQGAEEPAYRRLAITNRQDDEAVRANDGQLTLTVETDPPLSRSHLLRAEIDGQPASVPVPGNGANLHQLLLTNIDRGTHSISAVVVNARGEVVQRTAPLEIHVQRTSLNQPGRTGPNQAPRAPAAPRAPNVPAPGGN